MLRACVVFVVVVVFAIFVLPMRLQKNAGSVLLSDSADGKSFTIRILVLAAAAAAAVVKVMVAERGCYSCQQ